MKILTGGDNFRFDLHQQIRVGLYGLYFGTYNPYTPHMICSLYGLCFQQNMDYMYYILDYILDYIFRFDIWIIFWIIFVHFNYMDY